MTEDAQRLLAGTALALLVGLVLQASVPGPVDAERFLVLGALPAVLGVVAGRFLPRFVLVGLAILVVIRAPGAGETDISAAVVAAVVVLAIGLGLGVGGSTAAIALTVAPMSVLWIALQYGEPVSVTALTAMGIVTVTGLVAFGHGSVGSPWSDTAGRWWRGLGLLVATVPIIVLAMLVVPRVEDDRTSGGSNEAAEATPGDGDATGTFSYPGFGSELDISDPVELGDEIVFRVATDRSTFWRVGTFADFDGERWTAGPPPPDVGSVNAFLRTVDPGADRPFPQVVYQELQQTFTVERPLAGQIPTAWEPLGVDLWDRTLPPDADGNVSVDRPLTNGETYSVLSALPVVGADDLRRAQGRVPKELLDAYAAPPVTSDRVRDVAREVTAGATNDFDRVRALESWMADRVEYGRDIEPMPEGVDVVDHFLFESRVGFCEQIGTSLVVMARSLGLPARLVVGFVPDERDERSGQWIVRERNAHAWAEVWFPDVGWQAFDPTASVPLSADSEVRDDPDRDLLAPLLVAASAVLVAGLVAVAVWLVRRRSDGRDRVQGEQQVSDRLVELAGRAGIDTTPPRTIAAIAADVADRAGMPEVRAVAARVEEVAFTRGSLSERERAQGLAVLDRVERALLAQEEQESIEQPARVRAHSGRRSANRSRPG